MISDKTHVTSRRFALQLTEQSQHFYQVLHM